jgi:hypothetical protein
MSVSHIVIDKTLVFHSFARFLNAIINFVISVRPYICKNWAPTGQIFTKFYICVFIENLVREPKFDKHLTSITDTFLATYVGTFMISRCFPLKHPIHSQLNRAILLCDDIPDGKTEYIAQF